MFNCAPLIERVGVLLVKLSADLHYHCSWHTLEEVLPAAWELSREEHLSERQRILVEVAAALHDLGYLERYEQNEPVAVRMAEELLPDFGFSPEEIAHIGRLIMATQMPQHPRDIGEQIICDADLVSLGSSDFFERSIALWNELATYGQRIARHDWLLRQKDFLENHAYFTHTAQKLWNEGKTRNLRMLTQALDHTGNDNPFCTWLKNADDRPG